MQEVGEVSQGCSRQSNQDIPCIFGEGGGWWVVVVVVVATYKVKVIRLVLTEPRRGAFMSPLCAEY